jgi:hypothetical protein
MAVKITWSLNVQVASGPKITGTDTLEVDAYDTIEVTVPKKTGGVDGTASAEVQPLTPDKVKLLVITSSVYKDLTYAVDGTGGATGVKLDAQQLFVGAGAVGLLGVGGPKKITFTNAGTADALVQIFVGRKAS